MVHKNCDHLGPLYSDKDKMIFENELVFTSIVSCKMKLLIHVPTVQQLDYYWNQGMEELLKSGHVEKFTFHKFRGGRCSYSLVMLV